MGFASLNNDKVSWTEEHNYSKSLILGPKIVENTHI